ncbi:ABC transporter substrate-binding protein [Methylomicrobium sp. Wu6]|uniref:MlaC/ttg2D family ABC transporter substrate-binding protein n=1 Tax=Methylomicrobium sp. Wu6 TaxID=3107928 RepID=UPI002DD647D7|nr:ABC transporter substrate-binding protein [Methylomicrobium sp. Wu6]MEC4747338.1 ABC transporter substrate-binding protein [Methylomicrobium sp. Wu6]
MKINFAKPYSCVKLWISVWFLLFVGGAPLSKAETLMTPQHVIQQTADELQTTLRKPEYIHDFKKATALVDEILSTRVDFDRVSLLVLGKNWKTANAEQRERFKKEFRFLLVRTFTTAFTEYANWKIRFLPTPMQPLSDTNAVVRTEIIQPGAQPSRVDYRMILTGDMWKVYDIQIDGLSLLQNYRTSFMGEVANGNLDQLIAHLAQRNANAMNASIGR